jgi:tetratricopeptide (TPR) repeat protein
MEPHLSETTPITREALRRALRNWDSSRELGGHALAGLQTVETRRLAAGYSDTPAGRGLALREALQAAIEGLKPGADGFDLADRRWRPYFILSEQYLHGRSPEWVAGELCVSRRTYYNEQEEALEALADLLRRAEEQARSRPVETGPAAGSGMGSGAERLAPFLAPPRPAYALVGRGEVIQALKRQLLDADRQTPLAVHGLPGVGKSSLAIELAHDPGVRAKYPDGVLWAGLGRQPDLPALLQHWATALGLPAEAPGRDSLDAAARAVHAAIGLRRMLLVIDDAWEIEQALAFRLGGPNCATLLTTRLPHLALDFAGEQALHLHELESGQGLDLLAQAAPQAVAADPEAAGLLVAAVGGLPLALTLIARHLRRLGQPAQSRRLREALDELRRAETRLQLVQPRSPLETGPAPADAPASLQTIIGLSEAALDPATRQALRALALFPPKPDSFSEAAALAVTGMPLAVLDTLADGGLVEYLPPGRYTLHQTICDYARSQPGDPAAAGRYVAYFARFAAERTGDHDCLDRELNNLLAALDLADRAGQAGELIGLAHALHPFLLARGFYRLDGQQLRRAAAHAERAGREADLAGTLSFLGTVELRLGQYPGARDLLQDGATRARALGLAEVEAECLRGLGNLCYYTGDYGPADAHLRQALDLYRQAGQPDGEVRTLNSLGLVAYEQGDFAEARRRIDRALEINRPTGNRENEGISLSNLGLILADQGDYARAVDCHRRALQECRATGNLRLEAGVLDNLGYALTRLGRFGEARECYEQALRTYRQIGNQTGVATVLAFLGSLLQVMGDAGAACEHARQALELARGLGERYTQGTALTVLGHAQTDLGRPAEAAEAYHQAVDLFQTGGQDHLAMDALAGLTRLALAAGQIAEARRQAEAVLVHVESHPLEGALDPVLIQLTCVDVLEPGEPQRAARLLEQAHAGLLEQAACIEDAAQRRSFLEQVPSHRALGQRFAR